MNGSKLTDEPIDDECLEKDSEDLCVRCSGLISHPSRTCTQHCESEDVRLSFNHEKFKGRVCYETDQTSSSGEDVLMITGICVGVVVVLFATVTFAIRFKRWRKKRLKSLQPVINEDRANDREYFIKMVRQLRPEAPLLLELLNKTRKKYQSLNREVETVKSKAIKNNMRELGRILFVLNLKESKIKVPPDSQKLIRWAIKVLNHYKKMKMNQSREMETKVQVETNSRDPNDDEDLLFGTYMMQCEDGTTIMTTEL